MGNCPTNKNGETIRSSQGDGAVRIIERLFNLGSITIQEAETLVRLFKQTSWTPEQQKWFVDLYKKGMDI